MFQAIYQTIQDKEFRFTVYEDRIHVMNYQEILVLEDDYVLLQSAHKKIGIRGRNITLKKLLDYELYLCGDVLKIEVIHD